METASHSATRVSSTRYPFFPLFVLSPLLFPLLSPLFFSLDVITYNNIFISQGANVITIRSINQLLNSLPQVCTLEFNDPRVSRVFTI